MGDRPRPPRALLRALLVGALLAPAARAQDVVVGSKAFTEGHLLGEVVAVLLEQRLDLDVRHRGGLGGTLVCFEALVAGEIDLYVEYTGTGWATVLKETARVTDPLRVFLEVQARCREEWDLEWLPPLGFENTYAMALRGPLARELGVTTLSELTPFADRVRAGLSLEFLNRADGWVGLRELYGLARADVRGMEHALAYEALAAGSVDLVDAYSTDAKLVRYDVVVLEDDRGFFPPYHAAPVARGELLRARPDVRRVLEELAWRLDAEEMRRANHRVEAEGASFRAVAVELLRAEGLLEEDPAAAAPAADRGAGFAAFFAGRWRETLRLLGQHVRLTLLAVVLATVVAVPLGVAITRSRLAERVSLGAAGVVQTIPSLALLAFLIAVPGLGLSTRSAVLALTLYAVLPILRNTFTGIRDVDPELIDAARGLGLTPAQVLLRVQLPLATGTILAGVRIATVLTIGFATLAAFIGAGGLGEPIVTGLYLNDTRLILAGALPAAVLALLADRLLGVVERAVTPRGLRRPG